MVRATLCRSKSRDNGPGVSEDIRDEIFEPIVGAYQLGLRLPELEKTLEKHNLSLGLIIEICSLR